MSARKQENRVEAVRDAATGYVAVVLGIVCFILVLAIIVAGVRIVTGAGQSANTATAVGAKTTAVAGGHPVQSRSV